MTDLEKKIEEIRRRAEAEIEDLERKARAAVEKKIAPTIAKMASAMERAARKVLQDDPSLVDGFSFRRTEVEARLVDALGEMFAATPGSRARDEATDGSGPSVKLEDERAPSSGAGFDGDQRRAAEPAFGGGMPGDVSGEGTRFPFGN